MFVGSVPNVITFVRLVKSLPIVAPIAFRSHSRTENVNNVLHGCDPTYAAGWSDLFSLMLRDGTSIDDSGRSDNPET